MENLGVVETVVTAIAKMIARLGSRKIGVAIVGMYFLEKIQAPAWMMFGVIVAALSYQGVMDIYSIYKTGDETNGYRDNGNGTIPVDNMPVPEAR